MKRMAHYEMKINTLFPGTVLFSGLVHGPANAMLGWPLC
jgi:hypothetical protein